MMLILLFLIRSCVFAWHEDIVPKKTIVIGKNDAYRFRGDPVHNDHFKLLLQDGAYVILGGRNAVYNLSAADLTLGKTLQWAPTEHDRELCIVKGKSDNLCQNYVRVLIKRNAEGNLIACGTHAFKPLCREYRAQNDGGYMIEREWAGQGICPFNPNHNSTAVYTDSGLFAATVADFGGSDSLIYREPLRTEQSDLKQLNAPDFVSSVEYQDQVFFFFRETAVEYINCGKVIYSRVGRVCKEDLGGSHKLKNRWTSFLKTRLNCSVPGDFPFYFNEIQSTSKLVMGSSGREVIYGVFNTPVSSIFGSAVCAFTMDDILISFQGTFKEQETMNSNWLPVLGNKIPEPRPGLCVPDSTTLTDQTLSFVKSHPLMDESAMAMQGKPLFIKTSAKYRLTKVEVDPAVKTADGRSYDVMFIGTDNGRILKVINIGADSTPVVLEDVQVFKPGTPVKDIAVVRLGKEVKLVVSADNEVLSLAVQHCYRYAGSCTECVRLQDPYCSWGIRTGLCEHARDPGPGTHVQNIETGYTLNCSRGRQGSNPVSQPSSSGVETPWDTWSLKNRPQNSDWSSSWGRSKVYSAETLGLVVSTSCLGALIVGFLTGFFCSRRLRNSGYQETCFLDQKHPVNRNTYETKLVNNTDPSVNNKNLNLLLNVSDNSSTESGTLQKIKKTYL